MILLKAAPNETTVELSVSLSARRELVKKILKLTDGFCMSPSYNGSIKDF